MDLGWKTRRQPIAKYDGLHLDFRVFWITDHFKEFGCRWGGSGAMPRNLRGYDFSRASPVRLRRQRNRGTEARVHWDEITFAVDLLVGTEQSLVCPFDDLHDVGL